MKSFSLEDLRHLEKLASLPCKPEEVDSVRTALEQVLIYIHQLQNVDTEGVDPTFSVLPLECVQGPQEDHVSDLLALTRKAFLSQAPDQIGGLVRVPPLFETTM
jgi:aspartyl-tRNA(Asn)/glutamyl-tRNA(Gln) amidotransferase subunit C